MNVSARGSTSDPARSTGTGVGVTSSTSSVPSVCSRVMVSLNVPMPSPATDMTASPTIAKSK